jgi:hypothetical protein
MSGPPTLADLVADPDELDVSCLDGHHNATMPVAALLPRYPAKTLFTEVWGRFRCSVWGSSRLTFGPIGRPPSVGVDNPVIAAGPADH